jgi:hypothetical protein
VPKIEYLLDSHEVDRRFRAATPGTERQWIDFGMKRSCREIREMATEVNRMIKKDSLHSDAKGQQSERAHGCAPSEPAVCAHVCTQSNFTDPASGCTNSTLIRNVPKEKQSDTYKTAHVCRNTRPIQNDPGKERSNSSKSAHVCTNATLKDISEGMEYRDRNTRSSCRL